MKTFEYKGTQINVEEMKDIYMIAILMKYETMEILKDFYKESWNDRAEFLFHEEYGGMEDFIDEPNKFSFLRVIAYGEELKQELGMKPEDELIIREKGSQAMLNLDGEKKLAIEELSQRLMNIA